MKEEYKALMLFHILLHNGDITAYNYAAVDVTGDLFIYSTPPHIYNLEWWDSSIDDDTFCFIKRITRPEDFMETLIKL